MLTIRMSSAGYCPRRLSAMLLGATGASTPKWLAESADEGNWHEARLKEELRSLGCDVIDEQREVRANWIALKDVELVGHIDGRIKNIRGLFDSKFVLHYINCSRRDVEAYVDSPIDHQLLEVKSFSYLEHQRWMAEGFDGYFKHYAVQHALYREALDQVDGISLLASKDRSGGARNIFFVGPGLVDLNDIHDTVNRVAMCALQGDLHPGKYDPESLECRRCNYRATQCVEKIQAVNDPKLLVAIEDYISGASMEKEGKALKDQAKDILVAFATANRLRSWTIGDYSVTYSTYPRENVSIKKLEAIMDRSKFEEAVSTSIIERIIINDHRKED